MVNTMNSPSELEIVDQGRPAGLPVIFLHAFPLHSGMWDAQRAALEGRARFVAFNVRGMGKASAPGAAGFMLEHVVDDLFEVMDRLSIPAALLCGLSMGGYVALRAVERAPERVRGLLLCDTQSKADDDAAKLRRADAVRKVQSGGVAAYAEAFLPGALSPHTVAQQPGVVDDLRRMILESSPQAIVASLLALATRTDTTAALARIAVPTCVLVGEHDKITPPALAQELAGKIPGARSVVLPNAGHLSNLENPEAFNAELLQHIKLVTVAAQGGSAIHQNAESTRSA
jgi:3-oxoadipate enol-lactonase